MICTNLSNNVYSKYVPYKRQPKLLVGDILASTRTDAAASTNKVEHKANNPRGKSKVIPYGRPFLEVQPTRPVRPSVASFRQFETLWLRYREEVQLGKQAATSVLDDVAKGRLPCDADLLRNRARTLLLLDPMLPRLRLRQLLASIPRTLLAHDPKLLLDRAQRFSALLPSYDTTHVLMTVMPHLDRDPVVTAANLLELDDVFCRAFGGARVPPSIFAHLLRAPGATVLPPPQSFTSAFPSGSVVAAPPPMATATLNNVSYAPPAAQHVTQGGRDIAFSSLSLDLGASKWRADARGPRGTKTGEELEATSRPQVEAKSHQVQVQQQHQPKQHTKQNPHMLQEQKESKQQKQEQLPQGAQRPRELLLVQRRHINSLELLHRLEDLVSFFGRETAYVAVQRHPALLDRDPWDLGARALQLLAAIDPGGSGLTVASPVGTSAVSARPLARLLEDAPKTLDLELGEVRRRLQELSAALSWGAEQVAQLVLHNPLVLLRNPSSCRENVIRLRLYALRRPSSWGVELGICLGANNPTAAVVVTTAGAATRKGNGRRQHDEAAAATTAAAAATITDLVGGGSRKGNIQRVAVRMSNVTKELDAELLSLVARILTVDEELIDRFEYLVLTGQRNGASIRELLYESRVKFVQQCPRYSRWWAEGAARQRGEGGGAFGLGSGLEDGLLEGLEEGTDEMGVNKRDEREIGVSSAWVGSIKDDLEDDWVEEEESIDRVLDSEWTDGLI
ncbi:hypothetical protein VaNZ11_001058 [Volvox africanus]|uniref:Uncharacterized protein n=1 Tax=Volvox africanus TaxID=51714 RepID=A0ABQ5RP34_9CHLO|nr:hypothetical protein VaNZ11_001058 [Volvox africanus]